MPAPQMKRASCAAQYRYNFKHLSAVKSHPRWHAKPDAAYDG
jgi:hypothetical protein